LDVGPGGGGVGLDWPGLLRGGVGGVDPAPGLALDARFEKSGRAGLLLAAEEFCDCVFA